MPPTVALKLDLAEPDALHTEATKADSSSYFTSYANASCAPKCWSASVVYNGHSCTLRYNRESDRVSIARLTRQGRERVVLNIPSFVILNVESAAEAAVRQSGRAVGDEIVRKAFHSSGSGASLLCMEPSLRLDQQLLYAHSRSNTGVSQDGVRPAPHPPRSNTARGGEYWMHYVRIREKEVPSIHSITFTSASTTESVAELYALVLAVLRRVYVRGAKNLSIFISPISGKGQGVPIYATQVYPLLHFSRHDITVVVTKRAHECEDYVADLANRLDCRDVVVSAGGDGMIHEVVNGLHRRRLAVVRQWRRTRGVAAARGVVAAPESDAVPQNESAPRVTDVPPPSTEPWQPIGSLEHSAVMPEFTNSTTSTTALHTPLDAPTPGSTSRNACRAAPPHTCGDVRRDSDPLDHSCPGAGMSYRSDGMHSHLYGCPFEHRDPVLEDGWPALLPLVATIATGSACGLAKSMDVLSVTSSALALIHLHSCRTDLLRLRFVPNAELVAAHRTQLLDKAAALSRRRVEGRYTQYQTRYGAELQARRHADPATTTVGPFLQDGTPVFDSAVALHVAAPRFTERVAFMSLSFGVANDIDRGSESLRWLGNARFSVYGGYVLLKGVKTYHGVMRYLPWSSKTGVTLEKLHRKDKMPRRSQLPVCTMREFCPHCEMHAAASSASLCAASDAMSPRTLHCCSQHRSIAGGSPTFPLGCSSSVQSSPDVLRARQTSLSACTDEELLGEDEVDFDDDSLPWVTIRGAFYNLLLCNIRDTAQDMIMAPVSHLSDGAIDVVFAIEDKTVRAGGRREFLKFFTSLEKGNHVNYEFTSYVKASAVEVKVDAGIVMADGEMMPLDAVRVTKLRDGVRFVRSE